MSAKLRTAALLERLFAWLESWADTMRERVALCPECGRNRYTGKPRKGDAIQ